MTHGDRGARARAWLDHKRVGLLYGWTALSFLLLGFLLMLILRWQLAAPGRPVPAVGGALARLFGDAAMPGGVVLPEFYNQLGSMHGTVMIFLGVVPLASGAFGNYLLPLQIGAREMAFPRLNLASYWLYLLSGLTFFAGFFLPGGAAQSGWTSYPPLSVLAGAGQTAWLLGMIGVVLASLLNSLNILVTVLHLRAPGVRLLELPFLVHAQVVSAVLLLLAFPPLQAGVVFQLCDRLLGTSFFLPQGLVISGQPLQAAGGGSPLLWQHLFWFLGHPEVYVLILPAMGIVAEVIRTHGRRPLWGKPTMLGAVYGLGLLSMLVWAHHMFLTGLSPWLSALFQTTTLLVSIPSVLLLTCLLATLHGASIRFTTPMLFALAFLPMFGLGGLMGLPLGLASTDQYLHDTFYVVGHFHYIVAPGTLFGLFAGLYHWFPLVTGRKLGERLGRTHFWLSLLAMNGVFLPMFFQGLAGLSRRLYDPTVTAIGRGVQPLNLVIGASALLLLLAQVPFVINLWRTLRSPALAGPNPWDADSLEWGPPPAPQPEGRPTPTGLSSAQLGTGLFVASEAMLFAGLLSGWAMLRSIAPVWPPSGAPVSQLIPLRAGVLQTGMLMASGGLVLWGLRAGRIHPSRRRGSWLAAAALGAGFLLLEASSWRDLLAQGHGPGFDNFFALHYALTGTHALHLLGGVAALIWVAGRRGAALQGEGRARAVALYWVFVDAVWMVLFCALELAG